LSETCQCLLLLVLDHTIHNGLIPINFLRPCGVGTVEMYSVFNTMVVMGEGKGRGYRG